LRTYAKNDTNWFSRLDSTYWIFYIHLILKGSNSIAKLLNRGRSVLVHCSHGWDRTSQLISLATIILDPYYRTIKGFQVLIEKDWISMGHRFQDRLGHISRGTSKEEAPIFLQFMDCVYQLILQYPTRFQFNTKFLVYIIEQMYTCNYGTFILNSEEEITKSNIRSRTVSLWTYMNLPKVITTFTNPLYNPDSPYELNIEYSIDKLVLWSEFYGRAYTDVISTDIIYIEKFSQKFTSYEENIKKLIEENEKLKRKYQELLDTQKQEEKYGDSLSSIEDDDNPKSKNNLNKSSKDLLKSSKGKRKELEENSLEDSDQLIDKIDDIDDLFETTTKNEVKNNPKLEQPKTPQEIKTSQEIKTPEQPKEDQPKTPQDIKTPEQTKTDIEDSDKDQSPKDQTTNEEIDSMDEI